MLFTEIINKNRDFLFLFKKGQSIVTKAFVIYYRRNGKPYNRLGIASSKKIGNAVKRNRARRAIRAAYRECEIVFPIGYDIIFVARAVATEVKSYTIKKIIREKVINEMNKAVKK